MSVTTSLKEKAAGFMKNVKLDQEGLELFRLSVSKDSERSRLNIVVTSEIGLDFEGDTIENVLATLSGVFLPGKDSGK